MLLNLLCNITYQSWSPIFQQIPLRYSSILIFRQWAPMYQYLKEIQYVYVCLTGNCTIVVIWQTRLCTVFEQNMPRAALYSQKFLYFQKYQPLSFCHQKRTLNGHHLLPGWYFETSSAVLTHQMVAADPSTLHCLALPESCFQLVPSGFSVVMPNIENCILW